MWKQIDEYKWHSGTTEGLKDLHYVCQLNYCVLILELQIGFCVSLKVHNLNRRAHVALSDFLFCFKEL